jgi:hypothetical protein
MTTSPIEVREEIDVVPLIRSLLSGKETATPVVPLLTSYG